MRTRFTTLILGSCLTYRPLWREPRVEEKLACKNFGPVNIIHTFGDMFQTIEVLRGQKNVPRELRSLCHMSPKLAANPAAMDFAGLDLALIEPSSPIELTFRGYSVNRVRIRIEVLMPIEAAGGPDAVKLSAAWMRRGLAGLDEQTRAEAGRKLAERVQGDTPEAELARAILRETRASRSDIVGGFRKIQELLGCPIGAVLYNFRYMPDGRVIGWPSGFREEVQAAVQQLDLPVFEPTEFVREFGIEKALAADFGHYKPAFQPIIADALVAFAQSVYARANPARRSRPDRRMKRLERRSARLQKRAREGMAESPTG